MPEEIPGRALLGDPGQMASVREVTLRDGSTDGLRAVDVRPAGGIHALVLADRGMDVGPAWVGGWPLHWQSPAGFRHPSHFDGRRWLDSFGGGLLVTCGLSNVGPGCSVAEESFCQHGRFSNLPATGVHSEIVMAAEAPRAVVVAGSVRESSVYGVNILLERTLRFEVGEPRIELIDIVRNEGFEPAPLFLLYHFNLGYPVISPTTELRISPEYATEAFTDSASELHARFAAPRPGFAAEVFEHRLPGQETASATLENRGFPPSGGIVAAIGWDTGQLPRLWQWRMLGAGMYLTGIEPANCGIRGRAAELSDDSAAVDVLPPGGERRFDLTITAAVGNAGGGGHG